MGYLSLSRAARLAGVTRAEIQRRIRRGDLETFEGAVAIQDLLLLYPAVSLHDDEALLRVERIKSAAVPKSHHADTILPSPEVLVARLRGLSATLVERMSALTATESLLDEVGARLRDLPGGYPGPSAAAISALQAWFAQARLALAERPTTDQKAQLLAKDTFLRIMAANCKLIPSGHDFFVEGAESILDASVRAGLKLGYGCASGNCGECKARVLSGEVARTRDHDYVLSEREKQLGYILTCSTTAVTDLVLEAAEALSVQDLPRQEIRASLRKLEPLAPDLVSLNVQTPRTHTLRFMAGQRVILTLEDGASRELPIASCPCNGRNLWFYVRRGTDAFAAAVFGGLHAGQLIKVTGPQGAFVLREDAPEPAVFIAIGDGIAPVKSLIEHAVSIDLIESFHLYWGTTYPEGHYQSRWGRALTDALDNFSFTPLISDAAADLIAALQTDHADLSGLRFYLAGPAAAVRASAAALGALGVAQERMASEYTDT
jgi:CDP-4-dehydro-6-deoxyglucose reductase